MSTSSAAPPVVASSPAVNPAYVLPELPTIEGIDTAKNPLNAFRLCAAKQVAEAWGETNVKKVFDGIDFGKKNVDLALALPRFYKKDPEVWAQKVVDSFQPNAAIASCEFVKPFLQFTINKPAFTYHTLRTINLASRAAAQNPTSHTEAYGTEDEAHGKHMLIDFSSPNIAKPFHAGHLRSTIIGAVISNFHEAFGWKVTRLNYLGDWGTQYGMLSIGFDRYGNEEALVADPIKHLFEVYVKVNEDKAAEQKRIDAGEEVDPETTTQGMAKKVFKAMEDGEPSALAQWSRFREYSIEALKGTYEKLNIHFDVYWGESQVAKESMERAIQVLHDKNLITEDRGALLVDLKKYKLEKGLVRKADGTSIYLTRDLGGAYDKWLKYKFDKHIYVVQAAQTFHFKQLFKTLELMEEEFAGRFEHVSFGMVNGMSTRKGTVVFLEDILEEATETMHDQMRSNENKYAQIEEPEKTSAIIGDAAVKIQDFSGKRVNDYAFDMKRCTSFEGDFGPFIQYSHVRLCSVQRKNPNVPVPASVDEINMAVLDEPKVHDIIYQLALYPQFLRNAYTANEPSTLVTWCFKLSHLVGSAWESVKVSGASEEEAQARLFLYVCTRDVLAAAMKLLSLVPIERM